MAEQKKESGGLGGLGNVGSVGKGLGIEINIRLGEILNVVDQLSSALQSAGGKVTDKISDLVATLKEHMPGLKEAKEKEGGAGEATSAYNRAVTQLREAGKRGDEEARKMLGQLGEKTEAAGEKVQEKAAGHAKPHATK